MSESALIDSPREFTERAIPLLKEWSGKLRRFKRELLSIDQRHDASNQDDLIQRKILFMEFCSLYDYFHHLHPAMTELAQQVSGMIDQGKVTPLTRVELKLRLSELESELGQVDLLLKYLREKKSD
jgi:hypothetical protein